MSLQQLYDLFYSSVDASRLNRSVFTDDEESSEGESISDEDARYNLKSFNFFCEKYDFTVI